jgi:integrase
MERLATHIGGIDGHLVRLAFSTGLRMGELFAIRPENIDEAGRIQVVAQVRKDGKRSLPKTRKTRLVTVLPYGKESLKVWLAVPVHERPRLRHYHEIMARACRKLWPNNPDKRIRFHDLRHSFAIEMLRLGESLTTIAGLLGNSVQVCQTYYTGFSLKSESLDALDARLAEKFKAQAQG